MIRRARPAAVELGPAVRNRVVLRRVDSTSSLARRLIDRGWTLGTTSAELVIRAVEQTAGRGRQGRQWSSAAGLGIYVSVLRAFDDPAPLMALPLAVPVALATTLRELGCDVRLKWPNDLQVGGRKLGGVLIESLTRSAGGAVAIVGFGINHGHREEELPVPQATSLRLEAEVLPDLDEVAARLEEAVVRCFAALRDAGEVRRRYEELSVHRAGDRLRCRVGGEDLEGSFLGFDAIGRLRLGEDGGERLLAAGEVLE